jgi:hypothetical protein
MHFRQKRNVPKARCRESLEEIAHLIDAHVEMLRQPLSDENLLVAFRLEACAVGGACRLRGSGAPRAKVRLGGDPLPNPIQQVEILEKFRLIG